MPGLLSVLCCILGGCAAPPLAVSKPRGSGATAARFAATAFFVRGDGLAVTAAHAVAGCRALRIKGDPGGMRPTPARAVLADPARDLALLQSDADTSPAVLGLATPPVGGMEALRALGYPAAEDGVLEDVQPRAIRPRVQPDTPDPRFAVWIADPAIGHGWSGGPVLSGGRVVGVVLSVMTDTTELRRVVGRAEPGVATGADVEAVRHLLAQAGVAASAARGRPQDAVVRVLCERPAPP
jgi:S1-C subfamily serine protease